MKNHENLKFPIENHENHENHWIPKKNHENHENLEISKRLMKIMKKHIIPQDNQEQRTCLNFMPDSRKSRKS